MRAIFISLQCLCFSVLFSQNVPPPLIWQHCYGGSLDDYGYGISPTSNGGFIFIGCAGSNDGNIHTLLEDDRHGGTCDYWGAMINADSVIQFKFHYGGTASDVGRVALETSDGNFIIGGAASSNDVDVTDHHGASTDPDFWTLKINSSGNVIWKKSYGGSSYDDFGSMVLTSDGGYVMCGGTQSSDGDVSGGHGSMDFWLVKIDAAGNIQWQKCLGGSNYEKAFDLRQCTDGGYIMAGFTSSNDVQVSGNHSADIDGWIVKTDASGNLQWQKCLGGTLQDGIYKVLQLADGNFLTAGYAFSNDGDITGKHGDAAHEDAWITLLDPAGNLLWSKCYGGDSTDEFLSVRQSQSGGIFAGGFSRSINGDVTENNGSADYWLVSVDESGNLLWNSVYGGQYADVCSDLAIATDGRVAMIGYSKSDSIDVSGNHGMDTSVHPQYQSRADYWVVDLGSVVGVSEISKSTFRIIPGLAHDVIQISSPEFASNISVISVRNERGELLIRETINRQSQQLLNVSSLQNGIYFIEVVNENFKIVRKFVKM